MHYISRLYIQVKDQTTWEKFRKANQSGKIPHAPSSFSSFLESKPAKDTPFVVSGSDEWYADTYDAHDFADALVDTAPSEFMLLSDSHSSATFDLDGYNYCFGNENYICGGEPIVINIAYDECDFTAYFNEEYLDFDIEDFPTMGSPGACQIYLMTDISNPCEWIRFAIGTGLIELEDEEDAFLTQMGHDVHHRASATSASAAYIDEESEKSWKKEYGRFVSHEEAMSFRGKICVATGAERRADWEEIEDALTKAGAIFRSAVSGKTNYLICDPRLTGTYKTEEAIKQIKAGKPLKILLIDDVINALSKREKEELASQKKQRAETESKKLAEEEDRKRKEQERLKREQKRIAREQEEKEYRAAYAQWLEDKKKAEDSRKVAIAEKLEEDRNAYRAKLTEAYEKERAVLQQKVDALTERTAKAEQRLRELGAFKFSEKSVLRKQLAQFAEEKKSLAAKLDAAKQDYAAKMERVEKSVPDISSTARKEIYTRIPIPTVPGKPNRS